MVTISDRFVLASEAGRLLGLSPQRIRQLVDQGRLAARRGPRGMRLIERFHGSDGEETWTRSMRSR